ncbi:MAG TPA: hypothetical protein VMV27_07825 [Candidatus Binataceae bacterium]|nr:hypothetical protein [Candidatus Binataceae bacterium]
MNTQIATTAPRTRKRDQQVRRIIRRLRTLAPHLDNPVFLPTLQSFARVSLMLERGYSFLRAADVVGDDGEIRSSYDSVRRMAETAARLAKELGLTPSTLRAMSREKAVDLPAHFAERSDDGEAV